MLVKIVLCLTVLCVVIGDIHNEKSYDGRPYMPGYYRNKRGKYGPNPQKYYGRPSTNSGPSSYLRPPNTRPSKVSNRPTNDGLGEEDINNIVNYLSEQDLDKIIELAGKKDRDNYKKEDSLQKHQYSRPPQNDYKKRQPIFYDDITDTEYNRPPQNDFRQPNFYDDESDKEYRRPPQIDFKNRQPNLYDEESQKEYNRWSVSKDDFRNRQPNFYDDATETYPKKALSDDDKKLFKRLWQEIDTDLQTTSFQESQPFAIEYNTNKPVVNYVTLATPTEDYFKHQNNNLYDIDTAALAAEESMLRKQIEYLKSQINDGVVYTDSKIIAEENLPKPLNLRDDQDHEVSFTNNVATIVKREQSNSYKLENFGKLPIMNYDSKLDSVSSYHVPHYTVTSSPSKQHSPPDYIPPPSVSLPYGAPAPAVEPAPPASAARAQSDAHQKAVRIWSHKSQGTAYTLHHDGSLSLEKPGPPKHSYGVPNLR